MSGEGDGLAEMVSMLQEMGGWPEGSCRAALQLVGENLEGAAELLLGGFAMPEGMGPAGNEPTRALLRVTALRARERGSSALAGVRKGMLVVAACVDV